jgi:hypothetical protein
MMGPGLRPGDLEGVADGRRYRHQKASGDGRQHDQDHDEQG